MLATALADIKNVEKSLIEVTEQPTDEMTEQTELNTIEVGGNKDEVDTETPMDNVIIPPIETTVHKTL